MGMLRTGRLASFVGIFSIVSLGLSSATVLSFEGSQDPPIVAIGGGDRVPPLPDRIAVIGDSLSEALFVNQPLEKGLSTRDLFRLLGISNIRDPQKRIEAAREAYADHGRVWSSGDNFESKVFSHYRRINFLGRSLYSENYAVSGSMVVDLEAQVDQLLASQEASGIPFDYVTVAIGANDFNVEEIEDLPYADALTWGVEKQLRRIVEANPTVAIFWLGLPNILEIFESTEHIRVTRVFGRSYNCAQVRNMILGDSVLFRRDDTRVYSRVQRLLEDYQWESIRTIERLQEEFPSAYFKTVQAYSGFHQNYEKVLAFDCFHPSEVGQATMAEISWLYGFWGDAYGQLLRLASIH